VLPRAAAWDLAAFYAEVMPGRLIETRSVGVEVFTQCVVLVGVSTPTAGEEFHLPHVAMPSPRCGDGLWISQQQHHFPFRCSLISQLALPVTLPLPLTWCFS
jgi:hypothetical protein